MKNIIDLFSGVGGLSLGATHANLNLVGAVELDKEAIAMHQLNFPDVKHLKEDVSILKGKDLLQKFNQNELFGLIGGPPCQGFSAMGKQDINDPRNQLFIHFFRLVKEIQPVFFLAENVRGILHPKFSPILKSAFQEVSGNYHLFNPIELNARDLGVPTSRPRVFFIGIRKDIKHSLKEEQLISLKKEKVTVAQAFQGLEFDDLFMGDSRNKNQCWTPLNEIESNSYAERISLMSHNIIGNEESKNKYFHEQQVTGMIGTKHTPNVIDRFSILSPGQTDKTSRSMKLDPNGFCPTLRAGTTSEKGSFQAVRPIHPFYNRVISPREAARIQGFPDWFLFHPTKWHSFKQIGNSVSPIMASAIFETIIKNLEVQ
ncbi:DNA cytosine methyltransferase [Domibacillus sp.]|uniref:DNA cytosine methyltransferase n=1 Tax=Domibacillus sp. TaxID=1969783 RepID=UPI002811EC7E|nr:DNA cytosine methyltransferase [Domibacillus sp.]